MVDGAASLMSIFSGLQAGGSWGEPRGANLRDGGAPVDDTYATSVGRHLALAALAALEPKFFAELAAKPGLAPRLVQRQYDRRLWPEMREAIAAAAQTRTRDAWCVLLEGSDASLVPVLSLAQAPLHRHARERAAFITLDGVVQPGPAPRFDRSRAAPPRPAPEIGQDTAEVVAEAGFSGADIAALQASGAAR